MGMNKTIRKTLLLGALLSAALSAQAAFELRFVNPEKFTDAGETQIERERTLGELEAYMRGLADKRLPVSQKLSVEVLDVNLAGDMEPRGRAMDRIRVVKAIGWPSMELRFVLSEGDKTLREGKVRLSDMNFLSRISVAHSSTESLRYEKQLLDDWFAREFAAPKP